MQVFRANPRALIGNRNPEHIRIPQVRRRGGNLHDRTAATVLHGVIDQVHQHLIQLVAVRRDDRIAGQRSFQRNVVFLPKR